MTLPFDGRGCAERLAALASAERLQILLLLRDGPLHAGAISAALSMTPPNLNHHLTLLRRAGLLTSTRDGRHVLYSLAPGVFLPGDTPDRGYLDLGCCRLDLPIREDEG